MESRGNVQVKPTNTNNINNNIGPKMPPIEIEQRKIYQDLKIKTRIREVIIDNDNNNANPQTVEKIEVKISKKNKELDTSSINDKLKSNFLIKVFIPIHNNIRFRFIISNKIYIIIY